MIPKVFEILIILVFTFLQVNYAFLSDNLKIDNGQKNIFTFQGLMAPVFTPFNDDANRTINFEVIPEYAKFLVSHNITGILVGGTTGEGTSLSVDERKKLTEAWSHAVKETGQHLMVQIGGVALVEVKNLAAHAQKLNVSSLLCLPDLYFKPHTVEELVEYLHEVSESAPNTPLLYYQSTKAVINVKAADLMKFARDRIPTLAGIKLDSSDIKEGMDALSTSKSLSIIYGSKMVMTAGCAIGVNSFMTATLNFIPEYSLKLLDFCKGRIDLKKAQDIQEHLYKIEKEILKHGGYVEAMKTAMSLITNLSMGPPRSPLKPLSQENMKSMLTNLSNLGVKISKNSK